MVRHEVRLPLPLSSPCALRPAPSDGRELIPGSSRAQAAEAMGAIGCDDALPVLRKFLTHPNPAIRETCEIALDKVVFDNSPEGRKQADKYAPALSLSLSCPCTCGRTTS